MHTPKELPIQTLNAISHASTSILAEAHRLQVHEAFMALYRQALISLNPTTWN